jgi:DNA primase
MAQRIKAEDISLVRERTRIDEVISEHVTLKSAGGGSLKGLCPFHDERSPSFHVTPSKGFYYCFGCGEGGDVLDFLTNYEHLSFAESVEKLADKLGVSLRYEGGGPASGVDQGLKRRVHAVNAEAAKFFAKQLQADIAEHARAFLIDRGFGEESWQTFSLGFAPRNAVVRHLRDTGFNNQEIVESGVAGQGDRGLYDRFRNRLVWPIHDLSGDVVGFGARRLDENGPKYLNTPETIAYKKSHVLYGLYQAKKAIATKQQAVVVEGYTDVMACQLAGIPNAVATCGTAFGSGHVQILRRILLDDARGEVVFTFDGDEPGRKAARKAYTEDQAFAARTSVAIAKDGMDPCDLRLKSGDTAIQELLAERRPLFEFVLRAEISEVDLRTAEGRAAGLRVAAPVVAGLKDHTLQPEYARVVSGWLGVEPERVMAEVKRINRAGRSGQTRRRAVPNAPEPGDVSPQDSQLQRLALKVLLQAPEHVQDWQESLTPDAFTVPQAAAVFDAMTGVGLADSTSPDWVRRVAENCEDGMARGQIHALVTEPLPVSEVDERYCVGVIARLLDRSAERGLESLRAMLSDPAGTSAAQTTAVLTDLVQVEAYRRSLREHWAGAEA